MGSLGVPEMLVIFIVALVLFGPKKLPELGKTLGRAISEFRRASNELKSTFEREMQSLEREQESFKEVTQNYTNELYSPNDSPYYDSAAYDTEPYDSTASNPSTVSASAPEGAESSESGATVEATPPVDDTVPRTRGTDSAAAHEHESAGSEHTDAHKG